MSAHDTPEVGSGETVGELRGCDFGCTTHDWAVRCDAGSDPSEDVWNERTRHWYCPLGNDNCGAHAPASPDPVQPVDAGEGLCLRPSGDDWECRAPAGHADGMHVWGSTERSLLFHNGWSEQTPTLRLPVTVDRETALRLLRDPEAFKAHVAAREAAWAEKYAAVGERDAAIAELDQGFNALGAALKSAEAALATALREKAEDRARVWDEAVRQVANVDPVAIHNPYRSA